MITRLRIALLALGVIAFTFAVRTGMEELRWLGIALVGAALFLRFIKR